MPKVSFKKSIYAFAALVFAAISAYAINFQNEAVLGENTGDYYKVVRVVDGDTIKVEKSGVEETVRLIGVDTPELKHPQKEVECFAQEASNKAKRLMEGSVVRLEEDPTQQNRDRYDRMLRYVYLQDGTLVNEVLIKEGYAFEYTYRDPYELQARFIESQNEAELASRGLWGDICNY